MGIGTTIAGYVLPVVKGLLIFFFIAGIGYGFWKLYKWGIGHYVRDWKIKKGARILMQDDKFMAWCIEAHEKGLTPIDVKKKFMLMNKNNIRECDERAMCYLMIQQELKGGGQYGKETGKQGINQGQDQPIERGSNGFPKI